MTTVPSTPATRTPHRDARRLLLGASHGVLATLSVEVGGCPFGSVTPYAVDRAGRPLILVAEIAQHTRNLDADPRASLTVLAAAGGADVQAGARLTWVGDGRPVAPGEELDDAAERYYRRFPHADGYHAAHDFRFVRLEARRIRYIGGFGDIRWIEPAELATANPFPRAQEARIVEHMNADHGEAMALYCRHLLGVETGDAAVAMAGIDGEGCDLLADGRRLRLDFDRPVTTPEQAREVLVELVGHARRRAAADGAAGG